MGPDSPGRTGVRSKVGTRNSDQSIFSERLVALLDDILAGRSPSAGRFCGYCYHPLVPGREDCPHCELSAVDRPAIAAMPRQVIEMHRLRRSREGLVVRAVAWGGLTIGVIVALLPLAFAGVMWWSAGAFFGLLLLFYLVSANLANSLGDALGYRWGQAVLRRRWERFVARRDGT